MNFGSRDAVKAAVGSAIKTWEQQGILSKVGFDVRDFSFTDVHDYCVLIRNQLTNFNLNVDFQQTWECTYAMTYTDRQWKISVATTNNKATTSVRN